MSIRSFRLAIDGALVERARRILGTCGAQDTVVRALEEVVAADARRKLIRRLETQDGLDLADEVMMRKAWRE